MTSDLSLRFFSARTVHTSLWLHTFTSQPCWMFRLMHCSYRTQCCGFFCCLFFFYFIYPGKFVVLSVPLWISFFEGVGQLMISRSLAFCAASEILTFNQQFGEIPQSDAQASMCTVKTPLNRAFPRWTPVLPVIREGWWDELHCNLPLLTSVNSNCQLVKEPQKVRQLSSGTSIHCEFQQEGGTQRDEEQKDEHCLFFFKKELRFISFPLLRSPFVTGWTCDSDNSTPLRSVWLPNWSRFHGL